MWDKKCLFAYVWVTVLIDYSYTSIKHFQICKKQNFIQNVKTLNFRPKQPHIGISRLEFKKKML